MFNSDKPISKENEDELNRLINLMKFHDFSTNIFYYNEKILDEFNLEIKTGEIHTIMGPNGTGKSTLSRVIMGDNRYFNIEYNPNCCVYLGFASGVHDLVRLISESGIPFLPHSVRTEDGWEITYQIPFEFIRRFFPDFAPTSGTKMRGNFYKCGDLTVKEHYLCWNMITCDPVSFHRPCDFGLLEFE